MSCWVVSKKERVDPEELLGRFRLQCSPEPVEGIPGAGWFQGTLVFDPDVREVLFSHPDHYTVRVELPDWSRAVGVRQVAGETQYVPRYAAVD